jgi:hypothetical protein
VVLAQDDTDIVHKYAPAINNNKNMPYLYILGGSCALADIIFLEIVNYTCPEKVFTSVSERKTLVDSSGSCRKNGRVNGCHRPVAGNTLRLGRSFRRYIRGN